MTNEKEVKKVQSKDGTEIAYVRYGEGPTLLWVTGALGYKDHPLSTQLDDLLAKHFTVIDYDRRGRGGSGDTKPYATEREIEDIEALIDANGGSMYIAGMSSGAVLAVKAAAKLGDKVKKLALYEPPFIIDNSRPAVPTDYVAQLDAAIAAGDRSKAVEIFMTKALLIPDEFVASMKTGPMWADMEKVAHTLAYDGKIIEDIANGKPIKADQWKTVTAPTVVIVGGNSEPFFHDGAKALVEALPNAKFQILEGQDHAVAPDALAPVLVDIFTK